VRHRLALLAVTEFLPWRWQQEVLPETAVSTHKSTRCHIIIKTWKFRYFCEAFLVSCSGAGKYTAAGNSDWMILEWWQNSTGC
jgi:hypothetical protein